jgi:SNF2 family DNA or RNA helicase
VASQPKRVVVNKGGEEGLQQIRSFCSGMKHQQLNQLGQVLIVSYDVFRLNTDQFRTLPKTVGLLVVDEGHRLKNTAGSQTLSALEALPADARLCITATPIQNNLSEFYNLANFVCPGILGELTNFRRDYERPITCANSKSASRVERELGVQRSAAMESIVETFMLRRLQSDVLKQLLPPRTEALLFCQPSTFQGTLYQQCTSASTVSPTDCLQVLTALRKICTHPELHCPNQNSRGGVNESGKLQVLDALLATIRENAPLDKVVIVSNFTSALSLVETIILQPRGYSFLRLDGQTEVQQRQTIVDSFNRTTSASSFCFLLSSKAGGCGINLVGANRLIMLDPSWNPADDVQAMGRVYRQGQTKPCTLYRLFTAGTVEEVIYQRQSQKGNLATVTVNGSKSQRGKGIFSAEEIADCFSLKQGCPCDSKSKLGLAWPDYEGPDSLALSGCEDTPLLKVAEQLPEVLSFVHIVQENKGETVDTSASGQSYSAAADDASEDGDQSETDEEEFDE